LQHNDICRWQIVYLRIMTAELREQLTELLDEAELDWLKPHIHKDAVVIVNHGLDLVDVGVAIAEDNTMAVQRWIGEQLIMKPSVDRLGEWNTAPPKFRALIVSPYVLVQVLEAGSDRS
jgi:hypothetical protein